MCTWTRESRLIGPKENPSVGRWRVLLHRISGLAFLVRIRGRFVLISGLGLSRIASSRIASRSGRVIGGGGVDLWWTVSLNMEEEK